MSTYTLVRNSITLNARINGKTEKLYTKEKVKDANQWNQKNQTIKGQGEAIASRNQFLQDYKNAVDTFLTDSKRANRILSLQDVKDHVEAKFVTKEVKIQRKDSLLDYIQSEIDNNNLVAESTKDTWRSTIFHLKNFVAYKKKTDLSFNEMGYVGFKDFHNYLATVTAAINTQDKYITKTKRFMKEALKSSLHKNREFEDVSSKTEESIDIYYNEDEVNQMMKLKLKGTQQEVMDYFLFSCFTAIRFEDGLALSKENFVKDEGEWYLSFKQGKTGDEVFAPILDKRALDIAKKYNYSFRKISNQKTNNILKDIADENLILQDSIKINMSYFKGIQKKADLISFHDSRRTFCTNQFLKGAPLSIIMLCSGHKKESSLLKYLKADKKTAAKMLLRSYRSA
jgi:integrase